LLGACGLGVADDLQAVAADALGGAGGSLASALVTLENVGGAGPLDVFVTALGLTHSGAVRLADRLEAEGLATRERRDDDRRAKTLRLTPAGRRAVQRLRADRERVLAQWLEALTPAEQDTLAELAGRLLAGRTEGRRSALRTCRLCDADACGHPDRCPVTLAANAAEAEASSGAGGAERPTADGGGAG
jgi:DNA-binding MarR family transcriptional regulator